MTKRTAKKAPAPGGEAREIMVNASSIVTNRNYGDPNDPFDARPSAEDLAREAARDAQHAREVAPLFEAMRQGFVDYTRPENRAYRDLLAFAKGKSKPDVLKKSAVPTESLLADVRRQREALASLSGISLEEADARDELLAIFDRRIGRIESFLDHGSATAQVPARGVGSIETDERLENEAGAMRAVLLQTPAPAPIDDRSLDNGLTSRQMAQAFRSIRSEGEDAWAKFFSDPPKWAKPIRRKEGRQARWDPVEFAKLLTCPSVPGRQKGPVPSQAFDRLFSTVPALDPYREAWSQSKSPF